MGKRLDLLPGEVQLIAFTNEYLEQRLMWFDFWRRVDRPLEGCWEWQRGRDKNGYGMYGPKTEKAHRVAFSLFFGGIPEGLDVLHRCDNPPCVRPSHLFTGTQLDNSRDMAAKGRARHTKLTPDLVREIRSRPMAYGDGRRLAHSLGIHPQTLSRIRTGETWKEVKP